jgi:hypothetical protein
MDQYELDIEFQQHLKKISKEAEIERSRLAYRQQCVDQANLIMNQLVKQWDKEVWDERQYQKQQMEQEKREAEELRKLTQERRQMMAETINDMKRRAMETQQQQEDEQQRQWYYQNQLCRQHQDQKRMIFWQQLYKNHNERLEQQGREYDRMKEYELLQVHDSYHQQLSSSTLQDYLENIGNLMRRDLKSKYHHQRPKKRELLFSGYPGFPYLVVEGTLKVRHNFRGTLKVHHKFKGTLKVRQEFWGQKCQHEN